jgi:cytochrome c oxidase subunit 2
VALSDGRTVVADDAYLRDSILLPARDVVAGYKPIMPDFSTILDAGQVEALVAWLHGTDTDREKGATP